MLSNQPSIYTVIAYDEVLLMRITKDSLEVPFKTVFVLALIHLHPLHELHAEHGNIIKYGTYKYADAEKYRSAAE